jgi:RHS repeat-associated protein
VKKGGWSRTLKRALGRRDPLPGCPAPRPGQVLTPSVLLVASLSLLALVVGVAMWLGPDDARGDEGGTSPGPASTGQEAPLSISTGGPSTAQTEEFLESGKAGRLTEAPETDLHAAQVMPHRDLEGGEALELTEAVFEPELEDPGGLLGEIEPERYLSNFAAIVPISSLPESSGEADESLAEEHPNTPVLVESSMPLRAEADNGEEEPVDLGLEHVEGEIQSQNPLAEVGIPDRAGETISLAGPDVGIEIAGAPESSTASIANGEYAFYPNVAEDTDLIVSPTPEGVETLTDIRSAEAPMSTTYHLSLPGSAHLEEGRGGTAEVVEGATTTVLIPPAKAIDAAGNPVPVEMKVEAGDDLVVTAAPFPGTPMPILVDPEYFFEEWDWGHLNASQAAWTPATNAPVGPSGNYTYEPLRSAIWAPTVPGLEISSGFPGPAAAGTHADWEYWVPRYREEEKTYGVPPTSWIYSIDAEGVFFMPWGNLTNNPVLVVGLFEPNHNWTAADAHWGGEGEMNSWSTLWHIANVPVPSIDKGADIDLFTYENEGQAKRRDVMVAKATVMIVDQDAPWIDKLESPQHWMKTAAQPIGYEFEDTGFGIRSAGISFEGTMYPGWGFDLLCPGTAEMPCSRKASSAQGNQPLAYYPGSLPTGEDQLTITAGDLAWGLGAGGHTASGTVTVKVDHEAPELTLSGPLTEQERLGTLRSEYPLTIDATDGGDDAPQSGVAEVEVKVDGKKVSMPNEAPWKPACATKNCRFDGTWNLKASGYAPGSHEVEVVATDAVGNTSSTVLEVELGAEPLNTRFTSPHPSYETHELPEVSFEATREGKAVTGASFRCALGEGAEEPVMKPCSSPFELPEHLPVGIHTLKVAAIDAGGVADPSPALWKFDNAIYPAAPPSEKLVYPEEGGKTASWYTLQAQWGPKSGGEGVTGVSFQMKLPTWSTFEPVPAECTIDGQGKEVSWPLPVHSHPGKSSPVYLKVRGCAPFQSAGYPEKEVQFRAVFEGGAGFGGASAPVNTEFALRKDTDRVATDATETVGPATVDLLTGAYTTSHTDVSIPVPGSESNLEFTRVYNSSLEAGTPGYSKSLGDGWQPSSPLESEGEGEAWTRIEEVVIEHKAATYGYECWDEEGEEAACHPPECDPEFCEKWIEEEEQPEERWIELFDNEGASVPFEIIGGQYVAPAWANELKLTKEGEEFILAYPNGTHTIFGERVGGLVWLPSAISFQATPHSTRMLYDSVGGGALRLEREIAPLPGGAKSCGDKTSIHTVGCRTLFFDYGPEGLLGTIVYYNASGEESTAAEVARYKYNEGQLIEEWDPRLPNLREAYGYEPGANGKLLSITPPGLARWEFGYYRHEFAGVTLAPLKSVGRGGATTTIAYGVPVSGSGAPYDMSAESISRWGQQDLPVDATAIFPPTHTPSAYPPTGYTGATIDYLDPHGSQVNVASPAPPGVAGAAISTTETDMHGDVVRELGPQNRLRALESAEPVARSHELDTHSVYNAAGTELLESWGPLHLVRLETGEKVEARQHSVTHYDEGAPKPPAGTPPQYLPTKETVGGVVPGREGEVEPRVTETRYDWTLLKPTETVVDPSGLDIRSVTKYNELGQVVETSQPSNPGGGGAGSTRTLYYSATEPGICGAVEQYVNLPCMILPAAQASGTGRPQLLAKKIELYDDLDDPTVIDESPNFESGNVRRTTMTYDHAGRQLTSKITGGGTEVPGTETIYSPTTGMAEQQQFVCGKPKEAECKGFNPEKTTTEYNALGQVKRYLDADGAETKTTYDVYGRPATVTDVKGTETLHYDEASGVLTSLEASGVGTFTGHYDADGNMVEQGLPNGLTAKTTYNVADEPTKLTYTKTSSCGATCTWFEENLERSVEGKILADTGTQVTNLYKYDTAGRLTEATETPTGGQCTSREYKYDADSNRRSKTTRTGVGGACAPSGGTTQSYTYDDADRLIGPTYDGFGRITSLPAEFAGGKAPLTTEYFGNNMVAKQSQGAVSNTFQLDSTGRQRQREQAGGVAGVEVFHYDGPGDSPSWTAPGSTWSRNVMGIGGELAAVQESSGTTTFKLTDLHGDVVASASSSPIATALLAEYRSDEFGEPQAGSTPGRFGWLGGKSRRTELASGVIQMGARSYVPSLGRFLTPDPVPGGSANPYDYANQDPVNAFDLDGNCSTKKKCAAQAKQAKKKLQRKVAVIRQSMRAARSQRQTRTPTRRGTYGGIPITLPWEHQVNAALGGIESEVNNLLGHSCTEKAETFGAMAGLSKGGSTAIQKSTEAAPALKVAGYLSDFSEASAFLGGVFFIAGRSGLC